MSLCALELEICLGYFYLLLVAGKRRKKTVPGEELNLASCLGSGGVWAERPGAKKFFVEF